MVFRGKLVLLSNRYLTICFNIRIIFYIPLFHMITKEVYLIIGIYMIFFLLKYKSNFSIDKLSYSIIAYDCKKKS